MIGLGITHDQTKPLRSPYGPPWSISWAQAVEEDRQPAAAHGLAALEQAVPAHACLGAVLNSENPAYLLSGRDFRRRVIYLSRVAAPLEASRAGLTTVVLSNGPTSVRRSAGSGGRVDDPRARRLLGARGGAERHGRRLRLRFGRLASSGAESAESSR